MLSMGVDSGTLCLTISGVQFRVHAGRNTELVKA
jgi:hypothetical protein